MHPSKHFNLAEGKSWLWLALGLLLLLLYGLGTPPLFDVDEGAFSEATREILVSGDWGHTTLNGVDRFDKPIGVYWLQAASAALFGLNEFAVRLPSALATWLASLALARFVATRQGARAGVIAAVIHATSLGSWTMAHAATADALLGLCLVLSAVDLWRYLEYEDRHALHRLAIWVGMGLLVKGPVAALIPLAALLLSCVAEQRWTALWNALRDWRAWIGMLGLSLPWYAYALWRHGQSFVDGFILKHNVERFSAPMEGHSGSWLYFLVIAPLLWMPWTPLLMAWRGRLAQLWTGGLTRRAAIWAGFVFVFFSLSGTKLPHYGLYAAPGVVVLLACAVQHAQKWLWVLCSVCLLLWQGLLLGSPLLLLQLQHTEGAADFIDRVSSTGASVDWHYAAGVWLALILVFALWRSGRQFFAGAGMFSLMAVIHTSVLGLVVWPWWAHALQDPVKTLGLLSRDWSGVVVQVHGHWPSFAFYRQQIAPRRAPLPGEMALVPQAYVSKYPDWQVLAIERDMSLVRRPLKDAAP